ncbi:MAG: SDR family NAD(P)-dependent oxidoreductase [Planctomycetota bacterium]|nr:MAG: SDR family NAD(P)-dependent oxidoreductase [Planctomycetota bacterium]
MINRWSQADAQALVEALAPQWGKALALRTYSSRLIGAEPTLVLHGGGNTSLKEEIPDLYGQPQSVLRIKASGCDLDGIQAGDHVAVDLSGLQKLLQLPALADEPMLQEMQRLQCHPQQPAPSIEAPVHAVIPGRYVDHCHADAILAVGNRDNGRQALADALGEEVPVLEYFAAGLDLAKAVAEAVAGNPNCRAMVWWKHGLVTWGDTAQESYERTIELVNRAEAWLQQQSRTAVAIAGGEAELEQAREKLARWAPVLRGALALEQGGDDHRKRPVLMQALQDGETLAILRTEGAPKVLQTPTLTADHLIRSKALPLWLETDDWDAESWPSKLQQSLEPYRQAYQDYYQRHQDRLEQPLSAFDANPRVVLAPGIGALAFGESLKDARIACDITRQSLSAKSYFLGAESRYQGLSDEHLFDMEYRPLQHRKLAGRRRPPLQGRVVLVTGAAGAIGAGICRILLEAEACVLATDLAEAALQKLVMELSGEFGARIQGQVLDVTDPASVEAAFRAASLQWGGVDAVVPNAGLAHVSTLEKLDLVAYERLERVNVHGTLLLLQQAARYFRSQNTGGDVVLISTKNVFAPGAGFGAYSGTKAAAHQLARIASLEMAELDVRVNMVAPDAVFSDGARKSGLWAEVGPDRMKARGLDEAGLESYYQNRNLLKARITAEHVGRAVLYFLSRQTPTTGATLPVDGGLPDATPR